MTPFGGPNMAENQKPERTDKPEPPKPPPPPKNEVVTKNLDGDRLKTKDHNSARTKQ